MSRPSCCDSPPVIRSLHVGHSMRQRAGRRVFVHLPARLRCVPGRAVPAAPPARRTEPRHSREEARAARGTPTRRSTGSSPTDAFRRSSSSASITPVRNASAEFTPTPCRRRRRPAQRVRPLDRDRPHSRSGRRPARADRRRGVSARRLVARRTGHALDRVDVTRPVRPADGHVAVRLVGQSRDPAPSARSAASITATRIWLDVGRRRAAPSSATPARCAICSASRTTTSCATSRIPTAITARASWGRRFTDALVWLYRS